MDIPIERRRCWAEIELAAIRHNAAVVSNLAGAQAGQPAGIMAIVKANAYGHGMPQVAAALHDVVSMFGVANLSEARALHAALTASCAPPIPGILILGPALPSERPGIVAGGFVPAVSSLKEAAAYSALGQGRPVPIHIALDTGMGRMGISEDNAIQLTQEILRLPDLTITGIATHLPVADEDEPYTVDQLARFEALLGRLPLTGSPLVHVLNSAGILRFPQHAGTLVRAGLMLYGISPLPQFQAQLKPALAWKTRITLIRDLPSGHGISYGRDFITPHPMRVATLAVGYADGYHRLLSGQGAEVLIHSQRCPILGRITMDQIMADVSHVSDASIGDEVTLIGSSGSHTILASELAARANTIPWEIFTSLGARVDRVYF